MPLNAKKQGGGALSSYSSSGFEDKKSRDMECGFNLYGSVMKKTEAVEKYKEEEENSMAGMVCEELEMGLFE